jgi:tetratricopeptide (TPR) repeat protein/DNA-binding response OmpR family regulator
MLRRPPEPGALVEPAVLVVGADDTLLPALEAALARYRVYVEAAGADAVLDAVVAAAPDLILLIGEAARDCGSEVLARLSASPQSSVVPIVIADDNTALDARLRAFRHGAAAVIPRSASVDAIASEVAKLAREIPERGTDNVGVVGESTLEDFVSALRKELRTGILSLEAGSGDEKEAVRLVFGSGRPLADFVDDFVQRVRKHVVLAEPLRYEFDERAGGTVQLLGADAPEATASAVKDLRLALADDDTTRADSVAQELRAHGASVAVTDLTPNETRFTRMRQVDPALLLIGEKHLQGDGYDLIRRMRQDTRLRWASLIVVRWEEVWSERAEVPVIERLAGTLAMLGEPERALFERAEAGVAFDTRLEATGPGRCLRALERCTHPVRVTVYNPRARVEVDVSSGLIVGARGQTLTGESKVLEGSSALSALMVLSSGRVHIERVQQPATANIMATVDVALNLADEEPPPIVPSIPTPSAGIAEAERSAKPREGGAKQPKSRVSWRMTLVLLGLAICQGALLAALLLWLMPKVRAHKVVARSPVASSAQVVNQAALAPPAAAPSGSAVDTPTARSVPSTPAATPSVDGSGTKSPSCEALLADAPKHEGHYPGAALEQLQLGHKELVHGDFDAAQRAFCQAIAWDHTNLASHIGLSNLLLLRRDGAGAAEWARRAVKLDPKNTRAQGLLGDALARTGDLENARKAWLLAAGVSPDKQPELEALARRDMREAELSVKKFDYVRAERFFRRVVAFNERNAEAVLGLAVSLLRLDDVAAAKAWGERAAQLAPRDPEARIVYGDILRKLGEDQRALMEWREAALLDPNHRDAKKRLARAGVTQ